SEMGPDNLNRLASTLNNLAPLLFALAVLSPVVASFGAAAFYARHRRARPNPERRFPAVAYVLVLLVCAIIAYGIGVVIGVQWGCSLPFQGSLCFLWGFFVVGPFASGLAILLVGVSITFVPADVEPVHVARTWTISSVYSKLWNGHYSLAAAF